MKPADFTKLVELTPVNYRALRMRGLIKKQQGKRDNQWSDYSATYALSTLFMVRLARAGHDYRLARSVVHFGLHNLFDRFFSDISDPKSGVLFGSISYGIGLPNEIVSGQIENLSVIARPITKSKKHSYQLSARSRHYDSARLVNASLIYHDFRLRAQEHGISEAENLVPFKS